ncbi:MAG: hypothetical protein WA049_06630 [Ferribacterium limneticum]
MELDIAKAIAVVIGTAGLMAVIYCIGQYLADDQSDRLIRKLDRYN